MKTGEQRIMIKVVYRVTSQMIGTRAVWQGTHTREREKKRERKREKEK